MPARNRSVNLEDREAFLKLTALSGIILGLLILMLKILPEVVARLKGDGGVFGGAFLNSTADSYRIMVAAGLILASGSMVLGAAGKILAEILTAGVLWQSYLWYSSRDALSTVHTFSQKLDVALFGLVILLAVWLLIYVPYTLVAASNQSRLRTTPGKFAR